MDVKKQITSIINENGFIHLDHFMSIVVAHYYSQNPVFGREGDFITAPEISELFGRTLAVWLMLKWETLGKPEFELVELGPGRGTLMYDLLTACQSNVEFCASLRAVNLLEVSPKLRQVQYEKLSQFKNWKVKWLDQLSDVSNLQNPIIIANEFFDAMPIRQYILDEKGVSEVVVSHNEGGDLCFLRLPSINADLGREIGVYEICQAYRQFAELDMLAGLVIDYGYLERPLTSTLQALRRHEKVDVLHQVGSSDITFLVDFMELANELAESDFEVNIADQGEFLKAYGIETLAKKSAPLSLSLAKEIESLTHPQKMGKLFKVLEFVAKP